MSAVSLDRYQAEERRMALTHARRGLRFHAMVSFLVCVGLVLLNVFVASEFPWSVFPVMGMSIGVAFHWFFGVRHGEDLLRHHQADVEQAAEHDLAA